MTDFISREINVHRLDVCTKEFVQVFIETDCHDCYEGCQKTNEEVFKCIKDNFYNALIVNKMNLKELVE